MKCSSNESSMPNKGNSINILNEYSTPEPTITVIIPTTAETNRKHTLSRAINSIKSQKHVDLTILIIINGNRYDEELFNDLKERNDIKVLYQEEGNLPKAICFGRKHVYTQFFSFLDDDDCYLPDVLFKRITPLLNDNSIDYTVTNGLQYNKEIEYTRTTIFPIDNNDAARMILVENWLASCGGTFRSSSITTEMLKNIPKYLEWTYIGFMLSTQKKGYFLSSLTFRVYETDSSLSKSEQYKMKMIFAYKNIKSIAPKYLKKDLDIKYGKMLHDLSCLHLNNHQYLPALKYHLLSLTKTNGYTYLLYSRYFFYEAFKSLRARPTYI